MSFIAKLLVAPLIALLSWAGYAVLPNEIPQPQSFGSFTPAGGLTYYLKSSIGTTNTSIVLSSLKNRTDIPLTMTNLNTSVGYGTLDPQTDNSEFVSFTGITQNADGSATLTGVTRGLADIYPFTASTTMRNSHAGQSVFILSDSPQFYQEFPIKRNTENITGSWGFDIVPYSYGTATSTYQFATRAYANSLANQGAATSTINASGIGLLATGAQAAAGTYTLTSPYFLSTLISTSTWFSTYNNQSIITKTNDGILNTIDVNFLPRATWLTWTASSTFLGETYIAASTSKPIYFNQVSYKFPSSQGASSTVLMNDGSGNLNSYQPQWELLGRSVADGTSGTTTVTLASNNASRLMILVSKLGLSGTAMVGLRFNNSGTTLYSGMSYCHDLNTANAEAIGLATSATSSPLLASGYGGGATPIDGSIEIQVQNFSTNAKIGTFMGMNTDSTSAVIGNGEICRGFIRWYNTSSAITSVSIITTPITVTFAAGTEVRVYGSRD